MSGWWFIWQAEKACSVVHGINRSKASCAHIVPCEVVIRKRWYVCVHLCDAAAFQRWNGDWGHSACSKPPSKWQGLGWHITESQTHVLNVARQGQQCAVRLAGRVGEMQLGGEERGMAGRRSKERESDSRDGPQPQVIVLVVLYRCVGKSRRVQGDL